MKKLAIVLATLVFALVVSGCSNSGITQQVTPQEPNVVQGNMVISHNNGTASNIKNLDNFLEAVNSGKQANLRIEQITYEGDPILQTLKYNNGLIRYTFDNSKDKWGGKNKGIRTSEYVKAIKEEDARNIYLYLIDKNGVKTEVYLSSK